MHHCTLILVGLSLVIASCERKNEYTEHVGTDVSVQKAMNEKTSAIYLAALAAVVADVKPHRSFTFALSLDFGKRTVVGFSAAAERQLMAASGDVERYVSPVDVLVPKEGQMETMVDGSQRYVCLTSRVSGERLDAYMVESIEETSPTTVKVNWSKYCSPFAAHGGFVELIFEDGKWTAKVVRRGWVS